MKKILLLVLVLVFTISAPSAYARGGGHASGYSSGKSHYSSGAHMGSRSGEVHVRGYTKKDGTYVAPHYRSAPDGTRNNNWSTKGVINPHTGKEGTKNPEPSNTTP